MEYLDSENKKAVESVCQSKHGEEQIKSMKQLINSFCRKSRARYLMNCISKVKRLRNYLVRRRFVEVITPLSVCIGNIVVIINMWRIRVDIYNGVDEITLQNIFRIVSTIFF